MYLNQILITIINNVIMIIIINFCFFNINTIIYLFIYLLPKSIKIG